MLSPQNVYSEHSPNSNAAELIQFEHKRSSGSEMLNVVGNNYRVPTGLSQQQKQVMMSSTHSANWRAASNSEIKSTDSTRAYSAAIRILKPKTSSTVTSGGVIIPKVHLKKKNGN